MSEPKTYVPKSSVKERQFPSGGSVLKLSFHASTLIAFVRQHANAKGYINLGVSERKQPGQYGDTHCVWLDTWEPQAKTGGTAPKPQQTVDDTPVPF
jgi:hypothetical protein